MRVHIHANCQAIPLAGMLKEVYPNWEVTFFEAHTAKIIEQIGNHCAWIRSADLVLSQPIHRGYRDRDELSIDWVRDNVRSDAMLLVVPSLHFTGQHPGLDGLPMPGLPLLTNLLAAHLVASGCAPADVVRRMLSDDLLSDSEIDAEIQYSLDETRRREVTDRIDIKISPFLEENCRTRMLFHIQNHPFRETMAFVTNQLLERLGLAGRVPVEGPDYQPVAHIPPLPAIGRFMRVRRGEAAATESDEMIRLPDFHPMTQTDYYSDIAERLAVHTPAEIFAAIEQRGSTMPLLRRLAAQGSSIPGIVRWLKPDPVAAPPAPALQPPDLSDRELVMQFESLGGCGHGCEFGLFQRNFGAEPMGLLRWADLPHDLLAQALENRFEGVGLPENTLIFLPDGNDEWWTKDTRYWMAMRSFVKSADVSLDRMTVQVGRRFQFLRRKLIEDLKAGEKVFVFKNMYRNLTEAEIARLHEAVRAYGEATLFYVQYADQEHPGGSVHAAAPGLLIGYINHFWYSPDNKPIGPATDVWYELCRRAYRMYKRLPPEALPHRKAIDFDPSSKYQLEELADIEEAKGNLAAAIEAQEKVVALEPEIATAHHRLAHLLNRLGQKDRAVDAARIAVALDPANTQYRIVLSGLLLHQGRLQDALNEANIAVTKDPESAWAYGHLGDVLQRNGDIAAEPAFLRASELAPHNAHFRHQMSHFLLEQQRLEESIAMAREASALDPDNPHRIARVAHLLAKASDVAGAAAALRKAVRLAPEHLELRLELSSLLAHHGWRDDALAEAQIAAKQHPANARALSHLAHVMQMMGNHEQATDLLHRAIEIEPSNDHLRRQLTTLQSRLTAEPAA
jgi:tetratricopeptide (TPR) repeat protein